jgi:hypothetical protein
MRVWALALMAATLAGLLAWAAAEAVTPFFAIPPPIMDPRDRLHFGRAFARFVAATRNAALAWGIIGGLLGLALGVAGAAATAFRRVLPVALAGAILGAVLGASPTLAVFPLYWDYRIQHSTVDQLWLSLSTHAAAWSPVGLAGGWSLGLGLQGRGRPARAASGGLAGAILGVVAYEMLGVFVLSYDTVASEAVPGAARARLFAALLVAVGAATGATLAATTQPTSATIPVHPRSAAPNTGDGEGALRDSLRDPDASRTASRAYGSGNLSETEGLPSDLSELTDPGAGNRRARPG